MAKKGIVLLSGGLDSFVSLDISKKNCEIMLALTFDYGQKAFEDEFKAANEISNYYNIENKTVELPFLKELSDNALTNPNDDNFNDFNSVWIPNRNGLFLNIAAAYCDKFNYDCVIFGANKEEAQLFSDNSTDFIQAAKEFFNYSTQNGVEIIAPCLQFDKLQIINYAIDNNLPLKYLKSCYRASADTGKKHCGSCMSCKLLYNALEKSARLDLIKELF